MENLNCKFELRKVYHSHAWNQYATLERTWISASTLIGCTQGTSNQIKNWLIKNGSSQIKSCPQPQFLSHNSITDLGI